MKETTQRIIDLMKSCKTIADVYKLPKLISKKEIEECLTDESLDADDIEACNEMLKMFFNHERDIN